jgi:hypothetical protein
MVEEMTLMACAGTPTRRVKLYGLSDLVTYSVSHDWSARWRLRRLMLYGRMMDPLLPRSLRV